MRRGDGTGKASPKLQNSQIKCRAGLQACMNAGTSSHAPYHTGYRTEYTSTTPAETHFACVRYHMSQHTPPAVSSVYGCCWEISQHQTAWKAGRRSVRDNQSQNWTRSRRTKDACNDRTGVVYQALFGQHFFLTNRTSQLTNTLRVPQ